MNTSLNTETVVQQAEGFVQTEIDGDTVMMSIEQGDYFGLDPVAGRIWKLMETPIAIDAIIEQLVNEYDVDKLTCENDVFSFLGQMQKHNIIKIISGC